MKLAAITLRSLIPLALSLTLLILAPAQAAPAPEAQESYTLNIYNEGGGKAVLMQDLIDLIHRLSPGAEVKWDLAGGILLIETTSQHIQVLSRAAAVIINGQQSAVSRPVLVRQEGVYIPVDTVRKVFDALGVSFDIQDDTTPAEPQATPSPTPAAPTPAPAVPAVPGVPLNRTAPTPLPTAAPTPTLKPSPTPAVAAPATSGSQALAMAPAVPKIMPSYKDKAQAQGGATAGDQTPLQPPGEMAGRIGLTWSQLSDAAHRTPPQRITIVHDTEFRTLGDMISEKLAQALGIEVNLVAVNNSRRDSDGLVSRVAGTNPGLVIDLENSPQPGKSDEGGTFVVWTVHDALWPADRETGKGAATDTTRYRRHEFQSMALGSLLRTYIGKQFDNRTVVYELSPSYLMRRLDAPSATVLIPGEDGREQNPRLAEAVSNAVANYVQGMMRFGPGR